LPASRAVGYSGSPVGGAGTPGAPAHDPGADRRARRRGVQGDRRL